MENIDFATLFQGIGTMMASGWVLASAYGDDPYGTGNGSYQLRNTDYARRHTG